MAHYRIGCPIVNRVSLLVAFTLAVLPLVTPAHGAEPAPAGTDVEQRVLEAVNEVRQKEGLDPLAPDAKLAGIARDYSCVMARRNFFAHESPAGKTMADRVKEANLRYAAVAENLAKIEGSDPVERAVSGWMKSPGHRENIMTPGFTRSGVGACRAGRMLYLTQLFLRPR